MTTFSRQVDRYFNYFQTGVLIFLGSTLILTVFVEVLIRYVFHVPLFGLEGLSKMIGVWLYFFGAVYGTREESHVKGDVAQLFVESRRGRTILNLVVSILSASLSIFWIPYAYKYTAFIFVSGQRTPGFRWPRVFSVSSVLYGSIFMAVYFIANSIKYGLALRHVGRQLFEEGLESKP